MSDDVTRRIQEQYTRFPYPSRETGEGRLKELANLLRLFARETGYDFRGKRVLDVGTGTGHRLITAARHFPDTQFVAVDLSPAPLAIARAAAAEAGVLNVMFREHDLLAGSADLGRFDAVLCMGVLHHVADPALGMRRLAELVADDGLLWTYLYGAPGSGTRMRRKGLLSLLLGADQGNLDEGIRLAKAMRFENADFGWNLNADDPGSLDALIVDSYFNASETLFDVSRIRETLRASDLDTFMVYGITAGSSGYLFDTALEPRTSVMVKWTDLTRFLPTPEVRDAYLRLPLEAQCRFVELAYEANGYTTLAFRNGGATRFSPDGRVARNSIELRQA